MGRIFLYFHQLVHFNFATKYFNNVMFLFIYMQKKPCLSNITTYLILACKTKLLQELSKAKSRIVFLEVTGSLQAGSEKLGGALIVKS